MSQELDRSSTSSSLHNTSETDNQLVWSNPVRTTLNPQITRQLAFSNILLDMAQSAKTPLGVNPFWESGATAPIEWRQWFSTLKMAIMARDSIEVDKLLKLKPQPTDFSTLHYQHTKKNLKERQKTRQEIENRGTKEGELILKMNAR